MFDRKRDMSTIMAKRKVGGTEYGPAEMKNEASEGESGEPDSRHMAAEAMIAAHKEGSAAKVKEAMINFIDLHMAARNNENEAEAAGSRPSVASDDEGY